MPLIGMGTWELSAHSMVAAAGRLGYRHFDCAYVYQNQKEIGPYLKEVVDSAGRENVFVTSKVWRSQYRPEAALESIRGSVRDLQVGYLDLVLIHWPESLKPGEAIDGAFDDVSLLDTWKAFEQAHDEGLVKNLGVSNFSLDQIVEIYEHARIKPVVNQVELHPFLAQTELVEQSKKRFGVTTVAYSPIGRGKVLDDPVIKAVAEEAKATPAQVALRWNIQRGVPVIPKASSEKRLEENLETLDLELTPDQIARIDALDSWRRFVKPSWHDFKDPVQKA